MSHPMIRTLYSAGLALLLIACGRPVFAQTPDSPAIAKLMAEAESNARLVSNDADTLESFTRSRMSWQSHAHQLEIMRAHVNDLVGDVNQLNNMRGEGSEWQQEAIDRVTPLMQSMTSHLTTTIEHLQNNQNRVHLKPYVDYARGNRELAERTLSVIEDYVDYAEAKTKADSLEKKLEISPAAGNE